MLGRRQIGTAGLLIELIAGVSYCTRAANWQPAHLPENLRSRQKINKKLTIPVKNKKLTIPVENKKTYDPGKKSKNFRARQKINKKEKEILRSRQKINKEGN